MAAEGFSEFSTLTLSRLDIIAVAKQMLLASLGHLFSSLWRVFLALSTGLACYADRKDWLASKCGVLLGDLNWLLLITHLCKDVSVTLKSLFSWCFLLEQELYEKQIYFNYITKIERAKNQSHGVLGFWGFGVLGVHI